MSSVFDESGVVAVAGQREAGALVWTGLQRLRHRGEVRAGVVASDGDLMRARHARAAGEDPFSGAPELRGRLAVGQVSGRSLSDTDRPLLVRYSGGQLTLGMAGRFTNGGRLRMELKDQGALFWSLGDAEVLLQLVARSRQHTLVNRLVDALWRVEGAYALVLASEDRMVAVRDPWGFRTLHLGWVGHAPVFASEDTAIRALGGRVERELKPGEMVVVDERGLQEVFPFPRRNVAPSVEEVLWVASVDATVFGQPVYPIRLAVGSQLAVEQPASSADVVVGLPSESALSLGYAERAGLPWRDVLRSAVDGAPGGALRCVATLVAGLRVVLVVPGIWRGERTKSAVTALFAAGAEEVHVRSAVPPVRFRSPTGYVTPSEEELLERRVETPAGLRAALGATTVGHLSLEGLDTVLAQMGVGDCCLYTFDGVFPYALTDPIEQLDLFVEGDSE